jgi:hypothetical protein
MRRATIRQSKVKQLAGSHAAHYAGGPADFGWLLGRTKQLFSKFFECPLTLIPLTSSFPHVKVGAALNNAEGAFFDIRLKPSQTRLHGREAGPKGRALVRVVQPMGEATQDLSRRKIGLDAVLDQFAEHVADVRGCVVAEYARPPRAHMSQLRSQMTFGFHF